VGPAHQFHHSPRAGRPQSRRHLASPHPITPRRPTSSIEMPIKAPYSPALIPPLESLLTPSSAINGLGCKLLAVTHQQLHPEQPPAPIKGEHHHRAAPHLSPPLFSPRLSIALTERHRHQFGTAVARPPRRSSTSGEALDRTLASSSSFPCSRGELSWTRAPVGRAPMNSSDRRQRPVHGGPEPRWSTDSWTRSTGFLYENNSRKIQFRTFCI
jgi:hypothetical protein